jgi:hypothetical protein
MSAKSQFSKRLVVNSDDIENMRLRLPSKIRWARTEDEIEKLEWKI